MSDDSDGVPEVIRNPPEKYDRIEIEPGVCGQKPNLKFGGSVHRLWVLHAVDGVEAADGIDGYIEAYGRDPSPEEEREMREAVQQALDFYEEYEEVFEAERERRERDLEKITVGNSDDDDDELMSELKRGEDPVDTSGGIDWPDDYSDRDRVESALVTELEPRHVEWIADVAGLEESRVEDILEVLTRDNGISRVRETTTEDGDPAYEINSVALFIEDVVDLIIDARSREGLERYLAHLERRREELVGKRGAVKDADERENIDQSISRVDTSISTAEQAINLYEDVDTLSRSE